MYNRGLIIQTRSISACGIYGGLPDTYFIIYFKSQLIMNRLRFFEIELNGSCFADGWWLFLPPMRITKILILKIQKVFLSDIVQLS